MAAMRGKKATGKRKAKRVVSVAKRKPAGPAKKRKAKAAVKKAAAKKRAPLRVRKTLARPRTADDIVANAKKLLSDGDIYPKGCSDFVCAVLGIDYKVAKDIMGSGADVDANSIGSAPTYTNVSPGDICGWLQADAISNPQADHVTVYIGEKNTMFIDVKSPGNNKPRALKNGYATQPMWKAQSASVRKRRLKSKLTARQM